MRLAQTLGLVFVLLSLSCNFPPPPGSTTSGICSNSCEYSYDGDCDDGGPSSDYSLCDYGTDCGDCGSRAEESCSSASSSCSTNSDCCSGICTAETDACADSCTYNSDCNSDCCRPLESGGSACYPSSYCGD